MEERPVASLADLAREIEEIRRDPRATIVRGALTDTARAQVAACPDRPLRRRKHAKGGIDPTLVEVSRQWVMIDIDGYPLPTWGDLAEDPDAVVDRAIYDLLPEAFHDVACFWQLSSSAGFKPGVLKAHLFFWLVKAITNDDLKLYLQVNAPQVDRAPFNAAQPHYIADPMIEGGHDPLPRRTGWRKGMDDAVELPAFDPADLRQQVQKTRQRVSNGKGLSPVSATSVEQALALVGDGDGLEGFHGPLLRATMLYAWHTPLKQRDDEALKATLRAAIAAAPVNARLHGTAELTRYASDAYLDDIIRGAFARAGEDRRDVPQGMRPHFDGPMHERDPARAAVGRKLAEVMEQATAWHLTAGQDQRAQPPHIAFAVDVGTGKSTMARKEVLTFSYRQKEENQPSRVLWLVPTIRLGVSAEEHFAELQEAADLQGAVVAIHRGRTQDDPQAPGEKMCLDLPSVELALQAGEPVDKAVCGGKDGACPFFNQCGYQRQRRDVAEADVVIAAHELAFHMPAAVKANLGLTVMDEAWWQDGLPHPGAIAIDNLAAEVLTHPVLKHIPGGRQVSDQDGTNDLHTFRSKLQRAMEASSDGYVTRAALVKEGLTAEGCEAAIKLEKQRLREIFMAPKMTSAARLQAAENAGVNPLIRRYAAMWQHLRELLEGAEEATGRVEIHTRATKEGDRRVITLNTRLEIEDAIKANPVILLDATIPTDLVRHYLPNLQDAEPVRVQAPYMTFHQVVGGFGKTSLVRQGEPLQEGEQENSQNRTRANLVASLRDFVISQTRGEPAAVITYQDAEPAFQGINHLTTAHFNDIAGRDDMKDVRHLFTIGRPLPRPSDIKRLAAALTGKPVEVGATQKEARAVRMRDGTGAAIEVRTYADPIAEAIRSAITDAEMVQAIGRARGVNRTAENPVTVWCMADVVTPLVVDELHTWRELAPSPVERMAGRGIFLFSAADAAKIYPDLFSSQEAAKKALQRAGQGRDFGDISLRVLSIGECPGNTPSTIHYRPEGRGQQTRRALVRADLLPGVLEWLEEKLGPIGFFEIQQPEPEPEPPKPGPHAENRGSEPAEVVPGGGGPAQEAEVEPHAPAALYAIDRVVAAQTAAGGRCAVVFLPPAAPRSTPDLTTDNVSYQTQKARRGQEIEP
ncbi:ATP-dependent DNA helicase [Teichococcus wenyumeiae]|nr:hypothetical protein [Pseudoroseomonas wenyumeiae]